MKPTRDSCDHQRLSMFTLGQLEDDQRRALEEHLEGCAACRDDLQWMEQVGDLLGSPEPGHPRAAELTAHAAGELSPGRQQEVTRHLGTCLPCKRLVNAARAGLEELRSLEGAEAEAAGAAGAVHGVLALPAPPALRAAAHDGETASPGPRDRRVLHEGPGGHRLVYYRRQAHGVLALFYEPERAACEVQRCSLDDEALQPEVVPEGQIFDLGLADKLWGKTVRIRFSADGRPRDLSWTVVREG